MRNVVVFVLITGLCSSSVAAGQGRGATGNSAIKACSFVPKDLALKVSGAENKRIFDLPSDEEPVGKGSACEYGDIRLQIDAFPWATLDASAKKDKAWVQVSGVGDGAWFRDNRNFAELMGRVGERTFTIQMGVPFQSTAEKMKPNVITLANSVVAKLK
jgi:hypothetical protein